MGVLSRLFGAGTLRAASSTPPPMTLGPPSSSFFSFYEIDKNTTAIACTNVIANSISILPLNLYFKNPKDGSRQKAGWHPLYTMLKKRPNSAESPTQFFHKLTRHILQKGNVYIFKLKDGAGNVVSLQILDPEALRVTYDGWKPIYTYAGVAYTDADILHIPSLYTDAHGHGKALVDLAKSALTLGNQLDQASLASFGNGINSKLFVDIQDAIKDIQDPDQVQKVVQQYADYIARNYAGEDNAGKPLIGLNGMKVTELKEQSSNREAELLESRKFQFVEICKVFGVPTWLINGDMSAFKAGGLEAAMIVYLNFCLMPYLRHLEQKFATLLSPYEQDAYYFEYDFTSLLRPDEAARGAFYKQLWDMGVLSANQIASKENLDALPDEAGDAHFVPAQNMPLNNETLDAYMSKAKAIAAGLLDAKTPDTKPPINSAVGA